MTPEEFTKIKKRIQFCMRHLIPVEVNLNGIHGNYIPVALIQRYSEYAKGIVYSAEMRDENRVNSTITVGIEEIDWPTEGRGAHTTGRLTPKEKLKIDTVRGRLEAYKKRLEYVNALTEDYSPEFIEAQTAELNELKSEVMSLIALLDYNKQRLVIERRFILMNSWRKICKDLLISDTFARQLYREGMIELYNKMKAGGLL